MKQQKTKQNTKKNKAGVHPQAATPAKHYPFWIAVCFAINYSVGAGKRFVCVFFFFCTFCFVVRKHLNIKKTTPVAYSQLFWYFLYVFFVCVCVLHENVGILGLPQAFYFTGYIAGICLLVFICCFCALTYHYIINSMHRAEAITTFCFIFIYLFFFFTQKNSFFKTHFKTKPIQTHEFYTQTQTQIQTQKKTQNCE